MPSAASPRDEDERPRYALVHGVPCFRWEPRARAEGHAGNFGDDLAPIIVNGVLASAEGTPRASGRARLLSIGSVLHFAQPGDVVWGSGLNGKVTVPHFPDALDVRAVRGPISRIALLRQGITVPAVFGDPALLLPDVFPGLSARPRDGGLLVIPNLNELDRFQGPDVLSPVGEPMEIVQRIAGAEFVTGSSLHAFIVADALGIPSRPILPRAEHVLKYLDHYAGTGRPDVQFADTVEHALELGPVAPALVDRAALMRSFPWDLWGASRRDAGDLVHSEKTTGPRPRVSVVLSTNNDATTVRESISSLLSQPGADEAEIVIVDDRSCDETAAVVAEIAAVEPSVRLVSADTPGPAASRNVGAAVARGDRLLFFDATDLMPDGALEALSAAFAAEPPDIVVGRRLCFSPTETWSPDGELSVPSAPPAHGGAEARLFSRGRYSGIGALDRRFWNTLGVAFPDVPTVCDLVPMTAAAVLARRVVLVDDVVCLERVPVGESPDITTVSRDDLGVILRQELVAAAICHAAGEQALARSFASEMYRQSVYPALESLLNEPLTRDIAVTLTLLSRSMPPPETDMLLCLVVEFAARAAWDAAAAAAALRRGGRVALADALARWVCVLRAFDETGVDITPHRPALEEAVARALRAIPRVDDQTVDAWRELAEAAAHHLGVRCVSMSPEAVTSSNGVSEHTLHERRRFGGRLTGISTKRGTIVMSGASRLPVRGGTPILYPLDGGPRLAFPGRIDVLTGEDSWEWTVHFRARGVPLHSAMGFALWSADVCSGIAAASFFDSVSVDRLSRFVIQPFGGGVVIERRRHWILRGAARVVRKARAILIAANTRTQSPS
jgi:hypothetical protein